MISFTFKKLQTKSFALKTQIRNIEKKRDYQKKNSITDPGSGFLWMLITDLICEIHFCNRIILLNKKIFF